MRNDGVGTRDSGMEVIGEKMDWCIKQGNITEERETKDGGKTWKKLNVVGENWEKVRMKDK